jgi:hypothetical protein
VYIRYRWGNLDIWLSKKPKEDIKFEDMDLIFSESIGGSFDGDLTYNELLAAVSEHMPGEIAWPYGDDVDDDMSREELDSILSDTASGLLQLIADGKLKIVDDGELVELKQDEDTEVIMVTDDVEQLAESAVRGEPTKTVKQLTEDLSGHNPDTEEQ